MLSLIAILAILVTGTVTPAFAVHEHDNLTDAEIKTAYENNAQTNAVTDAEATVIDNTSGTNTGDDTNQSGTNTGDMTNGDVKTAYEANADTNVFDNAAQTIVGNTSGTNTGDDTNQTGTNTGDDTNQTGTNTGDELVASITVQGVVELADLSETAAGTSAVLAVTPAGLAANEDDITWKQTVDSTTTADIDIGASVNPFPEDGITLSDGDRILLKDQDDAFENGIYVTVTAIDPATWTRATDFDLEDEIKGSVVTVDRGTINANKIFVYDGVLGAIEVQAITFFELAAIDTDAEVKTAYENNADTNVFDNAAQTIVGNTSGTNTGDDTNQTGTNTGDDTNQTGTNTGDELVASITVQGVVELADLSETDAGTSAVLAVTPAGLAANQDNITWKQSVINTTTADIDIGASVNPSPVDGVTLEDGERILLKDQDDAFENGIYVTVTAIDPATWTRATDYDDANGDDIWGSVIAVEEGTLNANHIFVFTGTFNTDTLGTDAITFEELSEDDATDSVSGIVELAIASELTSGAVTDRAITPAALAGLLDLSNQSWVLDEGDLTTNDATKVPTQQSVKTYVDTRTTPFAYVLSDSSSTSTEQFIYIDDAPGAAIFDATEGTSDDVIRTGSSVILTNMLVTTSADIGGVSDNYDITLRVGLSDTLTCQITGNTGTEDTCTDTGSTTVNAGDLVSYEVTPTDGGGLAGVTFTITVDSLLS